MVNKSNKTSYLSDIKDRLKKSEAASKEAEKVLMSGRISTRDEENNLPYYVLDYSAYGEETRTTWIAKNVSREFLCDSFLGLIGAVKEIESILSDIEALYIDFGITPEDSILIYDIRPMACIGRPKPLSDKEFMEAKAFAKCRYLDNHHIISNKAFWNPAEMIGYNPRPLDYSLYKELITESVWTEAIKDFGYGAVDDALVQRIGNKPYVSVNYSFEALTPVGLDDRLKYKLYHYYEDKLRREKSSHDNIRYEIIFNSYDFCTRDKLSELQKEGFTAEETDMICRELFELTEGVVTGYAGMTETDWGSVQKLISVRRDIRSSIPLEENNVMKLYKNIEDLLSCMKENVTPQYVRQARCEFMAHSFCETMVEKEYFTRDEMNAFMNSITTITSEFDRDLYKYCHGEMSRDEFNRMYGHLRQKTYDIRSDCYKWLYIDTDSSVTVNAEGNSQGARLLDSERLKRVLDKEGMRITPEKFMEFIIQSKKNKEYLKFEFNKTISLMLDIIVRLGEKLGIAREDMSYLEISDLQSYHSRDSYIETIEERRALYHAYSYLVLPDVIFGIGDIDIVDWDSTEEEDNCKIIWKTAKGKAE